MIRDSQPIHNIGFGVTSRDAPIRKDSTVEGESKNSGFVARALDNHPVLKMTTALVATGVAAGVAGKFVREGGLKLGYKLSQAARASEVDSLSKRTVNSLLKLRSTLDEFEGVTRAARGTTELVYEEGGRLTTGYSASGLLDGDSAKRLTRGFSYSARDGKEWMFRDQVQQSLIKQVRRLPYEVPAFYAADKAIGQKILGRDPDPNENVRDRKWYNPVPILADFAKDITKATAMQMGGFMIPAAFGSAAGKSSLNFYNKAVRDVDSLTGAKKAAAEKIFFTQGVLQQVGHDIFSVLGKTIDVSQRSTGAMAVAWTAFQSEKNPVQTLYRNRHGTASGDEAAGSAGRTLSKRDRVSGIASTIFRGNNTALNTNSLSDESLLNLIPGYKGVRKGFEAGKLEYKRTADAQEILRDVTAYDDIVGREMYQQDGSLEALSKSILRIQSKANSPLTRVNDFFSEAKYKQSKDGTLSDKYNPGRSFSRAVNRAVYKGQLKNQLINEHGVSKKSASDFVKSLRVDEDVTFTPAAGASRDPIPLSYSVRKPHEGGLDINAVDTRAVDPRNRITIGDNPIHDDDFFSALITRFNNSRYGQKNRLELTRGCFTRIN